MKSRLMVSIMTVFLAALPVLAHHPFSAEYDWKQPVTVTGIVSRLDWANPHAHIYVDAKSSDGKTTSWAFELGSINALVTAGWSKDTLKTGDNVTVDAWLSRSQKNVANVKSITLPNGRELSGASSIVDPNANPTDAKAKTDKV
jgi:Family of unknown function (DUF6152)